jgi:growth arrest and DNA-damage-inducible protein
VYINTRELRCQTPFSKKQPKSDKKNNCSNSYQIKVLEKNNLEKIMIKKINKFMSNSLDSGVFDFDDLFESPTEFKMNIGEAVKNILVEANEEKRLICGLKNASQFLRNTENPQHSLFFFIAPSVNGDSVTHMQEVVLQAFCFENDIYIIKIDSADKLKTILEVQHEITCALVQKTTSVICQGKHEKYSDLETTLIDHCEDFWDELIQPIIKLPEK